MRTIKTSLSINEALSLEQKTYGIKLKPDIQWKSSRDAIEVRMYNRDKYDKGGWDDPSLIYGIKATIKNTDFQKAPYGEKLGTLPWWCGKSGLSVFGTCSSSKLRSSTDWRGQIVVKQKNSWLKHKSGPAFMEVVVEIEFKGNADESMIDIISLPGIKELKIPSINYYKSINDYYDDIKGLITPDDPSLLESITRVGEYHLPHDRFSGIYFDDPEGWMNVTEFSASYPDNQNVTFLVDNFMFHDKSEMEADLKIKQVAFKFAKILGQLPIIVRKRVSRIIIHNNADIGNWVYGVSNKTVFIQLDIFEEDVHEEVFFHEAVHANQYTLNSTDQEQVYEETGVFNEYNPAWVDARQNDEIYISVYAKDNRREDHTASFPIYSALRYRNERISGELINAWSATIPARIQYYDDKVNSQDMSPWTGTLPQAKISSSEITSPENNASIKGIVTNIIFNFNDPDDDIKRIDVLVNDVPASTYLPAFTTIPNGTKTFVFTPDSNEEYYNPEGKYNVSILVLDREGHFSFSKPVNFIMKNQNNTNDRQGIESDIIEEMQWNEENKLSKETKFNIFPNPTSGEVTVVLPDNITSGVLKIIDLRGSVMDLIHLESQNQRNLVLDISNYPHGSYTIIYINDESVYRKRLIKNNRQ